MLLSIIVIDILQSIILVVWFSFSPAFYLAHSDLLVVTSGFSLRLLPPNVRLLSSFPYAMFLFDNITLTRQLDKLLAIVN